jgi:Cytochrome c7 and related cytochrome c
MGCHASIKSDSPAIRKLADFAAQKKPVPWAPVYRLPRMVYFSHEIHNKKAGVECATCHGPVASRNSLGQEKSIAMTDCMRCHDQYKVSNDCDLCHDSR